MGKENQMLVRVLLVCSILVGACGAFFKYGVLEPLGIHREENIMALPFLLLADDMLSYEVNAAYGRMQEENLVIPDTTIPFTGPIPTDTSESAATESETIPVTQPRETISVPPSTEIPEVPATEAPKVYAQVDESWFDDALFIGDSRTVGLRDYARLGDADYFCKVSMSLFNVMEWETFDEDFMYDTLEEVLERKTYGKIYIHLGLNEAGEDKAEILSKYHELIDMIRQYQPDAAIILQAIMSVTRDKTENVYFSLENIKTVNAMIEALAAEKGFFFEDVNDLVADEEGYMYEELTFDGCHLYGKGYLQWRQWIWDNAGWYGIP